MVSRLVGGLSILASIRPGVIRKTIRNTRETMSKITRKILRKQ